MFLFIPDIVRMLPFGACNVTLRHYFGERGFWYGGVGAGIARVSMTADVIMNPILCGG